MGRPMAATMARPVPAAHPAAMPIGRPSVPAPRQAVTFLTVAEVAAMMRVSKMTVYRLVHSGELPAVRVGRSFRVVERDVNEYLRKSFYNAG
jgi:excisionase family DNA binding protein